MDEITRDIIEGYFTSKQHEAFLEKNNTYSAVRELKKELTEEIGEDIKENMEEINSSLFAAFNIGEYYGVMQGIGIGLQLLRECT